MLTAMHMWSAAKSSGAPVVPVLEDADPRLIRACQILDTESALLRLKDSEDADRRASLGRGGRRG